MAEQLGLDKAKMTLEEARVEKERLQHLAGRVAAWFRYVRTSPSRAVLALLFLALPVALATIPNLLPGAMQWIASVIAAVPSVVWIASWIRSNTAPAVALIDKAFACAEEAEKLVRSRVSEEERRLEAERAQLAAAVAKLEQERLSLVERQAAIEAELELLRQGRSFKRYVLERAASQDYRKQLGLIASVHRDFKALSERLGDQTEPHVERIVLYIDDLDRCPPDRVVEVLQALYLILSLPLFVVVVAVDSAWLLQSLEAYYARQFQRRRHWESKPQHYLEKIFQIPYALPPMEAAGFRNLVSGMLSRQITAPQSAGPGTEPGKTSDRQGDNGHPPGPEPQGPGSSLGGAQINIEPPPPPRPPEPIADLTPRNLQIEPKELEFVATLAPLIPSPRSAKRLVNLYRIVRASLDSHELERFLTDGYQTTLLLLAAVVGCPSLAAELFGAIFSGRVQDARGLTTYLTQQYNSDRSWGALAQLLGNRSELADWGAVRAAVRACARYSFETGRILRADSPTPAAAADGANPLANQAPAQA